MKPDTARVFAEAEKGAKKAGDAFVTTERLLIAIAKEGADAAKILKDAGASPKAWRPPPTPSARAAPPTAPRPRKAMTRSSATPAT
jgi:ATP-dependent Clp protease ATP-binding subunit ClpA